MNIIAQAIQCINPGQIPVIAFDQPLYAIAKKLQWYYPHQYGTGKFVIMMGALHIEMSTLSALGAWLDDSGWTIALSNANVTTPGNQSLISVHDVAKTKYCHQVTACTLNSLMQEAYDHFREEKENISFGEWKSDMEERSPQFQFWSLTLKIELDYHLFKINTLKKFRVVHAFYRQIYYRGYLL